MSPPTFRTDVKTPEILLTKDDTLINKQEAGLKAVTKMIQICYWFCIVTFLSITIFFVHYMTTNHVKYWNLSIETSKLKAELRVNEQNLLTLLIESNNIQSNQINLLTKMNSEQTRILRELKNELNEIRMHSDQCVAVPVELRFDCHPEDAASELSCSARGCCWNPPGEQKTLQRSSEVSLNIPYCYYPKDWRIYRHVNSTKNGNDFTGFQENYKPSVYLKDIKLMRIDASSIDTKILRVKISDAENTRYEPFLPFRPDPRPFENNVTNAEYSFETEQSSPGFRVKRTSDKTAVFDSIKPGGFIFADQLLQISTLLPTSNVYGLGEHRMSFRLNMNWQTLTMFNKDQPPMENSNLYGSHPFYLVIEASGHCHGVLFLNSNAMDVILQPTPALTFRSIGGVFDIYFFMGPTPQDVLTQYSQVVGKPFMPPYWSLGFHLCRYGYGSLENTKKVWNRTRAAGIPFDTQWNDLDYMTNNNDFTYDTDKFKDLPQFLREIAAAGMHYIPLIDAGISASEPNGSYRPFDEGIRRKIFVTEPSSDLPFKGKVWNRKSTVWPDFTNPDTLDYWYDMMNDMWHMFPYDGAWLDMNEPSNFYNGHVDGCIANNLDNPPYVPHVVGNLLATKTLCMNAKHHNGSHYDIHNVYGMSEVVATHRALKKIRGLRPFIISRSTWVGHGNYAGHWSGDNFATWYDMKMSISQLLSFSLFQIPMMGSDICGFNSNTTQSLCNRWMQLGAFYPFSRNHNSDDTIEQDPVAMGDLVVKSSRKALMIRYRFLPYLYTLFSRAHLYGETVARPLFFEFTNDPATYGVDTQFLWGSALMILPVLEEGATQVTAYVPYGTWYDFYSKKSIASSGGNYNFEAPLDTIPLLVRGGSILPAQTPGKTTTASRKNNFELLIAPDDTGSAFGEMFWDDGDDSSQEHWWRWEFALVNQTVNYKVKTNNIAHAFGIHAVDLKLGKVQVMGVVANVSKVWVNGKETEFKYEENRSYLTVKGLQVDFTKKFTLSWQ